jgi:hypothetical protein
MMNHVSRHCEDRDLSAEALEGGSNPGYHHGNSLDCFVASPSSGRALRGPIGSSQ